LLSKHEAATLLGISARTFERHVMRGVPRVQVGGTLRYDEEDLKRWVAEHKVGSFESAATVPTRSASSTTASGLSGRRAAEILAELEQSQAASTAK
jgi:excisionase family DNA binding protein